MALIIYLDANKAAQRKAATDAAIEQVRETARLKQAKLENQYFEPDYVRILGYERGPNPPKVGTYKHAPFIVILDQNEECVGVMEKQEFKFVKYFPQVCAAEYIQSKLKQYGKT